MKRYLILLFFIFATSLVFISCSDDTTDPTDGGGTPTKGSVAITSNPAGAQIFQGATNTNKVTPDSIVNLDAGTINFTLKLAGFRDTTFAAVVEAGRRKSYSINLRSSAILALFGSPNPIRIWETTGTGATQPSGLILATGQAVSVADENIDIYYYSSTSAYELRSAHFSTGKTRNTYFKMGTAANAGLDDHIQAPAFDNTWVQQLDLSASKETEVETHYFFMYDQDGHYSKVKIILGGGTPGNPAFADLTWYYNQTAGDRNF